MPSDFSVDYSERSDDELLLLASDRASLTTEAGLTLDAELRRRNLAESDRIEYQQFIKHDEQRKVRCREMLRILKFVSGDHLDGMCIEHCLRNGAWIQPMADLAQFRGKIRVGSGDGVVCYWIDYHIGR
jgi:hypothetical protein